MDLYFYDSEYKFYTYTQSAEQVDGEYLIAQYSTPIEPPKVGEGCVAVFDEEASVWSVIIDNRGTCYSTTTGELVVFANPCQSMAGFTKVAPPEYNTLTHHLEWKLDKWVIVANVEVPSIENLSSIEDKLNILLKTNKVELREHLLCDVLSKSCCPLDRFEFFGMHSSDLKEVLGINNSDYQTNLHSLIGKSPNEMINAEFTRYENLRGKLNFMGIDPYDLKDLLDNLPNR